MIGGDKRPEFEYDVNPKSIFLEWNPMPNAKSVFPMYQKYVDAVHLALSELGVGAIANPFLANKLTLSQFESLWIQWGRTPGLQKFWHKRFALGYSNELKVLLHNVATIGDPPSSTREAA